ncbi:MAG: transketolase [Eggerthellaceae bacterium]|nr:transketolase [Eggerthellaceae bacterium]
MSGEALIKTANDLRIDIVKMIGAAGSGHPGGSLSCADIMTALYFGGVMDYDVADEQAPSDRFIMAKGHAAPALYAALAHAGYFPREELMSLRKFDSRLQGHPDSNLVPGVEVSTGSLGQGLSIAAGLAAGLRLNDDDHAVFALLGDGECQEGQVWEAAMFAAHQGLDNLVAIVDRNCLQIDGNTGDVCDPGDLGAKFAAFGWEVAEVDGHDIDAVIETLNAAKATRAGKPHVIIAHTIKGKGVSFMEDQAGWHGKAPNADQLAVALADLGYNAAAEEPSEPASAPAPRSELSSCGTRSQSSLEQSSLPLSSTLVAASEGSSGSSAAAAPKLQTNPDMPKKATRAAYGVTLAQLADEGLPIVAVDADLTGSTTTAKFAAAKPEYANRLFNCGIAEQNMTDVAAGLSLAGNIAFTGSFAVFGTGRAYDQIRNTVCYSNLNVKIAPTHAGISVGPDGGSHQMLEDISLMRGLPNMRVLVPSDYATAAAAIRLAANTPGPLYVRMGRESVPCVYADDTELTLGGSFRLREGADATIVACGLEVREALIAADMLAEEGISVDLIDAYSVKPLDAQAIVASAQKTGCVVTAEEHSVIGGLGSAVAEALASGCPVPIEFVGMKDKFGKSGGYAELSAHFKMDAAAIADAVKTVIARK